MALTGKTIGELDYLSGVTSDTLFPVEYSGNTYHIAYSAFTNSNYNEGTYDELYSYATGSTLTAGSYYLMTDYQTCYDQPNYDSDGNSITVGNYKTGTTEPLLLLATSSTAFSPIVFSTIYPKDKITYDITWNLTEVTSGPAKGRITERIDEKNNRADYDFRSVQFIRYVGYFSENYLPGKVSLDGVTGLVTGVDTTFTNNFIVGNVFGVYYPYSEAPIACFKYYEITSITNDTELYVSGTSMFTINNTFYSSGRKLPDYMSPFKCNITGGTNDEFGEYYTFNDNENVNTYLGDNTNYITFILSNNVFLNGDYENNYFAGGVVGNTFNDDMELNNCGPLFQYNIITNDFDANIIGANFRRNIIDCDMRANNITDIFQNNMLGDNDGFDFDYNTIQSRFSNNFFTFNIDDFYNNIIGFNFERNIIDSGFQNNHITGDFNDNVIVNADFNNNQIGEGFFNNSIRTEFNNNKLGSSFFNNLVYSQFYENVFGENVNGNTFGDPNNISLNSFSNNNIGGDFTGNYFSGNTQFNTIGFGCVGNNVDYNFSYNQIATNFSANVIAHDFGFGGGTYRGNIIGNGFSNNTVGEYCYDNTFGDGCSFNVLGDYFTNNKISHGFAGITAIDYDSSGYFRNNNFTYGFFNTNLALTGGTGGNPVFYTSIPTNVTIDYVDANPYVTFLSGGTIIAQTVVV